MHRRWIIIFLCALVLWLLVGQANHYLGPSQVFLFAGGLFVAFPALRLGFRDGFIVAVLAGMLLDAVEPVPFGTHLLLFAGAHAVIFSLRHHLPHEETLIGVLVALLANLGLFLAFSAVALRAAAPPAIPWLRLLSDLFFSEVFVALVAPWFFSLQQHALRLGGIDLRAEHRAAR